MTPTTTAATAATDQLPENMTTFEDASNSRWITARLAGARARVQQTPTEDAVERIRTRVFGEGARRRKTRSIAA